jgi:hypothetical protein
MKSRKSTYRIPCIKELSISRSTREVKLFEAIDSISFSSNQLSSEPKLKPQNHQTPKLQSQNSKLKISSSTLKQPEKITNLCPLHQVFRRIDRQSREEVEGRSYDVERPGMVDNRGIRCEAWDDGVVVFHAW